MAQAIETDEITADMITSLGELVLWMESQEMEPDSDTEPVAA